jgi:hypothetical protein
MKYDYIVTRETITPEMAADLVTNLFRQQRPLRLSFVEKLVSDIKAGRMKFSPDCIVIFNDGSGSGNQVANGQHRLNAVAKAGIPITFLVMRTNDPELYMIIDTGRPRGVSDLAHTAGLQHCKTLSTVAGVVFAHDKKQLWNTTGGSHSSPNTHQELLQWCQDNGDEASPIIAECLRMYGKSGRLLAPSLACAFVMLNRRVGNTDALEFIREVYEGGVKNASKDVRDRLESNRGNNASLGRTYLLAILIKGYRSWKVGTRPGQLKFMSGVEQFPYITTKL